MTPEKMTELDVAVVLKLLASASGCRQEVEAVRAHLAALEADVERAREQRRKATEDMAKAVDAQASAECRLFAIRQRAVDMQALAKVAETCAIMGGAGEWDDAIHADVVARGAEDMLRDASRGVARYLLGTDARDQAEDVLALRERVKVLEARDKHLVEAATNLATDRDKLATRLAAIRQRAGSIEPEAARLGVARLAARDLASYILGPDAAVVTSGTGMCPAGPACTDLSGEPTGTGEGSIRTPAEPLHCCGTTTDVHPETCPMQQTALSAEPSEHSWEDIWRDLRDGIGVATESQEHDALTALATAKERVAKLERRFSERPNENETSTAEALAALRKSLNAQAWTEDAANAIALLERHMGAMERAAKLAPHGAHCAFLVSAPAPWKCDCWKSDALTDAPEVFTLEEVERESSAVVADPDSGMTLGDWLKLETRLLALRK